MLLGNAPAAHAAAPLPPRSPTDIGNAMATSNESTGLNVPLATAFRQLAELAAGAGRAGRLLVEARCLAVAGACGCGGTSADGEPPPFQPLP